MIIMSENVELKDRLYYYDLIYKIKSLSGMNQKEEKETEIRIIDRQEMKGEINENGLITYTLSPFQLELFDIIRTISIKANIPFITLYEISKYSNLVEEALIELEKKNELNNMLLNLKKGYKSSNKLIKKLTK